MAGEDALPRCEISLQQLAAMLRLSPRTVQGHAATGVIPKIGPGRFPFPGAIAAFTAHLRRSAEANAGASKLADARQGLTAERAAEVRLRLDATRREFVERDVAADGWTRVDAILARHLSEMGERIAAALPHLTSHDRGKVQAELSDTLETVRAEAVALGVIGARS